MLTWKYFPYAHLQRECWNLFYRTTGKAPQVCYYSTVTIVGDSVSYVHALGLGLRERELSSTSVPYLSFIQRYSLNIVCNSNIIIYSWLNIGMSFNDPKLVYSRSFEMNRQQTDRKVRWMNERYACLGWFSLSLGLKHKVSSIGYSDITYSLSRSHRESIGCHNLIKPQPQ
jgi:hypothetical protein